MFDCTPSTGHPDMYFKKAIERHASSTNNMHYKSHNDMERVLEANNMHDEAKKLR